VTFFWIYIRII